VEIKDFQVHLKFRFLDKSLDQSVFGSQKVEFPLKYDTSLSPLIRGTSCDKTPYAVAVKYAATANVCMGLPD
jgi:hypothetical protein